MSTLSPGPSKLAESINKATSPASSTTGGESGSLPFADWLVVGDGAFVPQRAVAIKATNQKVTVSLDTGHVAELLLQENKSSKTVMKDLIAGKDIADAVKAVSITNP
jgi:hypothetical protein